MDSSLVQESSMRRWRTIAVASATVVATVAMLTGCSGGGAAPAPSNSVAQGEFPSYYPSDYSDVIAASKKEGGTLVIYSNTDQENWAPIFRTCHDGVAMRAELHEALGLQLAQRLAQGSGADAQLPCQVRLVERGAGRVPAGQDAVPHHVVREVALHPVVGRGGCGGSRCAHEGRSLRG